MITVTPAPSVGQVAAHGWQGEIDLLPLDRRMRMADRLALRIGLWLVQHAECRVRRQAERGVALRRAAVREATAEQHYESLRQRGYTMMLYHG